MYFRVFIEIFELQMYIQRHTPYQLFVDIGCYGLVRNEDGFSSGMNV